MVWKPNSTDYRARMNSLIDKRRTNAKKWGQQRDFETAQARRAQHQAEQEQKRGWGLPALLGGGLGMLVGGPMGAAVGAGIGGGAGLLRAGGTRGGGLGGILESLVDIPGAIEPIMKNPASVMPLLGAFAPYMKGLGGGGAAPSLNGMSGYGWDTGLGAGYGSQDFGGLDVDTDLGGIDPTLNPNFDPSAPFDPLTLSGGIADSPTGELSLPEDDDDDEFGWMTLKKG